MANENEQKPRDKGLGEYAKDFVGGLFGRDDDDEKQQGQQTQQSQQSQQSQQGGEERPHDKGIVEYTKDFVGGLFGRDDDDDKQQSPATDPRHNDQTSMAERLSEKANEAKAEVQQRQGTAGSGGSFTDRLHDAVRDAAQQAQQAQQRPGGVQQQSVPQPAPSAPAPKPAGQADDSELDRLRNRVNELEHQLGTQSAPQAAPQPQQAHRTYTVVPGDSLRRIAQRHYGDEMQWKRIYEANRDKISNPDLIHPGQVFEIPE